MVDMEKGRSVRINGALLPMHTGQQVVLAGTVAQVDPSGTSLTVKASDDKMVKVTLANPLQDSVEGVIEVHGVAQGGQVQCHKYITFPQMKEGDFDLSLYDKALKIMQSVKASPWKNS
ncbi:Replication protein A subunit [Chionoecetes opilio]|uniref:Replication protein A subunit n=1 Tax=Chionoecetes opilio TaxID=41210 RepID=A0A8J5C0K9_CHIOP|nr:Replication protein A subunit [Chionoecetes opilio]